MCVASTFVSPPEGNVKLQEALAGVQSVLKMFQKLGDSHHHLEKFDSSTY